MHPLFVLLGLIAASNFSVIILMKREGIAALKSWKTVAFTHFIVPIVTFIVIGFASWLSLQ